MRYVKSIGLNSNQQRGRGFNHPYDIAFCSDDRIYVLNRMYPQSSDGIRVQICDINDEWYGEFGHGPGYTNDKFLVPVCMVFDCNDRLYVTDESLGQIKIFDASGELLDVWGKNGSRLADLEGPSGICLDGEGFLLVVEQFKGVVKRIDLNGTLVSQFGSNGSEIGQFDLPWGISTDKFGHIYVADWRNDRVQSFTSDGKWLASFGRPGTGGDCTFAKEQGGMVYVDAPVGQFNRPSGVCVDNDGDIYVADWLNNRVQVLTAEGRFITEFTGDAALSSLGIDKIKSNPDMIRQRNGVRDFTPEKVLWAPCAVRVDHRGRVLIADTSRHRFQVYQKNTEPQLI